MPWALVAHIERFARRFEGRAACSRGWHACRPAYRYEAAVVLGTRFPAAWVRQDYFKWVFCGHKHYPEGREAPPVATDIACAPAREGAL